MIRSGYGLCLAPQRNRKSRRRLTATTGKFQRLIYLFPVAIAPSRQHTHDICFLPLWFPTVSGYNGAGYYYSYGGGDDGDDDDDDNGSSGGAGASSPSSSASSRAGAGGSLRSPSATSAVVSDRTSVSRSLQSRGQGGSETFASPFVVHNASDALTPGGFVLLAVAMRFERLSDRAVPASLVTPPPQFPPFPHFFSSHPALLLFLAVFRAGGAVGHMSCGRVMPR